MWTLPCLYTVASAVLLTLPRVIGTAVECGFNKEAASSMWHIWTGVLRLHSSCRMLGLCPIHARQVDMADQTCASSLGLVQERW
jgi:hypothetical protein